MDNFVNLTPVNLITGFLGSGKTTLLQRLLHCPDMANTAVIVNEFGEVGLDHLLLREVDDEVIVLQSGCICCTIRSDLSETILSLHEKCDKGEIPRFDRMVIETTGLADPAPIVSTLMLDPVIRHHYRLGTIVTTIDAVNADLHLANNPETAKQLAIADRIVITKTDIAVPNAIKGLISDLKILNPTAEFFDGSTAPSANQLLRSDLHNPETKFDEVSNWFNDQQELNNHDHHAHDVSRHSGGIRSFSIVVKDSVDWTAFGLWLMLLLHAHGENILRIKGILNTTDSDTPVVIHGVQHIIHPPQHLDCWPTEDKWSRLVFIVRNIEPIQIEKSFYAFLSLDKRNSHRLGQFDLAPKN